MVRATGHGAMDELRIWRVVPRATTGGTAPACLDAAGPVQFYLNWSPVGSAALAPVRMTITAPDGTPLVLGEPAGCHPAHGATFDARPGVQFVQSAALPAKEQDLNSLVVTIDDHTVNVPLLPICTDYDPPTTGCANDSLSFDGGSGYSATLALG